VTIRGEQACPRRPSRKFYLNPHRFNWCGFLIASSTPESILFVRQKFTHFGLVIHNHFSFYLEIFKHKKTDRKRPINPCVLKCSFFVGPVRCNIFFGPSALFLSTIPLYFLFILINLHSIKAPSHARYASLFGLAIASAMEC